MDRFVEVDDVRRKFLKCDCGQNSENLFYVCEQKPGRKKGAGFVRAVSEV